MSKYSNSLEFRTGLVSIISILIVMLLLMGVIFWSFNLYAKRNLKNNLSAYVDILVSSTRLDQENQIYISSTVDSLNNVPRYWQITSGTRRLKKNPNQEFWLPVDLTGSINGIVREIKDKDATPITILQKDLRFPSGKWVSYVFGMKTSLAKQILYEETTSYAQYVGLSLLIVALILVIISFFQIKLIMRPFDRIKNNLKRIRNGETEFLRPQNYPEEIQPLAIEIDNLIKHNATIIERHRTFGENLSHGLKTPLSVIRNAAVNKVDDLPKLIEEKGEIIDNIIESNLARIRIAGRGNYFGKPINVSKISEKIITNLNRVYSNVQFSTNIKAGIMVHIDEGDLFEMLGNIIENGYKYTNDKVMLSVSLKNNQALIIMDDNGKGIPENKIKEVLKRGTRLDQTIQGSGIGLPIAKEIIELYKGSLSLNKSELGGLQVKIILPL